MLYDVVYTSPKVSGELTRLHSDGMKVFHRRHGDSSPPEAIVHAFWGIMGQGDVKSTWDAHIEIGFFEQGDLRRGDTRSISIDGFGGSGDFYMPTPEDPERPFFDLQDPKPVTGRHMIIAQKQGDAALGGEDIGLWMRRKVGELISNGVDPKDILVRAHPVHGLPPNAQIPGHIKIDNLEATDLERTLVREEIGEVHTFSSSTALKTIAWGYQTYVEHEYGFPIRAGETRERWARRYSYRVWTPAEYQKGIVGKYLTKYLTQVALS